MHTDCLASKRISMTRAAYFSWGGGGGGAEGRSFYAQDIFIRDILKCTSHAEIQQFIYHLDFCNATKAFNHNLMFHN